MISPDLVLVGYYDYRLVTLSVLISILGGYIARDLSERLTFSRGRAWLMWLVCGATVEGLSTRSLEHTRMPAFPVSLSDSQAKLFVKFSLSNRVSRTTGRWSR